jgi:glycosyltransferase involved in cell wall biosynthesis
MPNKLTVLIPCKNEVKNIRLCIDSIRGIADEVLIADSGSTDGTLDVVREMGGCRIIEREYIHSGNFKNWAIPQASQPWILIVDADERVTPELAAEIKQELCDPKHDGYRILRRNHIFGREIKHCGWNNDSVLRLFRRDLGRYCDRGVHADVIISGGNVGKLRAKFIHFTYWNLEQYLEKFDRYTTLAARDLEKRGRRATAWGMLLRAPFRFLNLYLIRGGFRDGVPGLILCMLTAFYSFTKHAKLWAMHHGQPQPNPEAERADPTSALQFDSHPRSREPQPIDSAHSKLPTAA